MASAIWQQADAIRVVREQPQLGPGGGDLRVIEPLAIGREAHGEEAVLSGYEDGFVRAA